MHTEIDNRIKGCLLGGAIGDAMGAGIEFMSIGEIRRHFGPVGATGYTEAYGRACAITDDTQMALFTAEGLIRASVRDRTRGICHPPTVVRNAYLRWLSTQGFAGDGFDDRSGWLIGVAGLHHRRAPGTTCTSALVAGGNGSVARPANTSKGCGGVMRAAPAGFPHWSAETRFEMGCEVAAITHGHPDGYLPAGFLAVAVGELIEGRAMHDALDAAEVQLQTAARHSGTLAAVREGRRLGAHGVPAPEQLAALGGGWVGDEALAIAVACVVGGAGFRAAVLSAVNHTGDSDSTGSIAGNLLGAALGAADLPADWLAALELREVIEQIGADAALEFWGEPPHDEGGGATSEWFERYPGV